MTNAKGRPCLPPPHDTRRQALRSAGEPPLSPVASTAYRWGKAKELYLQSTFQMTCLFSVSA